MKEFLLKCRVQNECTVKETVTQQLEVSGRLLRRLKLNKRIFCNGKEININDTVNVGDEISTNIYFEDYSERIKAEEQKIDILYEDDHLLVINKQSDVVVHPTCVHPFGTLANFVKFYLEAKDEFITTRFVNRLDRETSGVIVFAKNEYIQECLSRQMQTGVFGKEYIAVAYGNVEKGSGVIDLPIKREPGSIMLRMVSDDGEKAVTHYEVLKRLSDMTVLRLKLETGRTHQIRVHLKSMGHPIVGDGLYSDRKTDLIARQALHAVKVKFIHPVTKELMEIKAPIPDDIKILMESGER